MKIRKLNVFSLYINQIETFSRFFDPVFEQPIDLSLTSLVSATMQLNSSISAQATAAEPGDKSKIQNVIVRGFWQMIYYFTLGL